MYLSETSKFREILRPFCFGNGLDIGSAGDPIVEDAINVDLSDPYAKCGNSPIQIKISNNWRLDPKVISIFFKPGSFNYIYSSHLLEDFENKTQVLECWTSLLRYTGYLVLLLPDEQRYQKYCREHNQIRNSNHNDPFLTIEKIRVILISLGMTIYREYPILEYEGSDYNFAIVAQNLKE